jgi:hypothetical protein
MVALRRHDSMSGAALLGIREIPNAAYLAVHSRSSRPRSAPIQSELKFVARRVDERNG